MPEAEIVTPRGVVGNIGFFLGYAGHQGIYPLTPAFWKGSHSPEVDPPGFVARKAVEAVPPPEEEATL